MGSATHPRKAFELRRYTPAAARGKVLLTSRPLSSDWHFKGRNRQEATGALGCPCSLVCGLVLFASSNWGCHTTRLFGVCLVAKRNSQPRVEFSASAGVLGALARRGHWPSELLIFRAVRPRANGSRCCFAIGKKELRRREAGNAQRELARSRWRGCPNEFR